MRKERKKPFKVIALLDGRPGHEKQTQGILAALSTLVELDVTFVKVPYNPFFIDVLSFFKLLFPAKKEKYSSPSPELVIGTGRRTHLALLHLKKKYGCPAITCMSPSLLLRKQFDLCFVPFHDEIRECNNIFNTVGPPNTCTLEGEHRAEEGLILLGGEDYSHDWDDENIKTMLKKIFSTEKQIQWTVSSSPRTPGSTITILNKLDKEFENCKFFDYKDTPSGWVEEKYAECQTVWVTADSMSMVYEAMSAGCKVRIIPVNWKNKKSKFTKSERDLVEKNRVKTYYQWLEKGGEWKENTSNLNESLRCANEIVRRWCPKK